MEKLQISGRVGGVDEMRDSLQASAATHCGPYIMASVPR